MAWTALRCSSLSIRVLRQSEVQLMTSGLQGMTSDLGSKGVTALGKDIANSKVTGGEGQGEFLGKGGKRGGEGQGV